MRDGRGGELRDEGVRIEALEREGRDQPGELPSRHELCERRPHDRRCFEAVCSPTAGNEESVHVRSPEDGTVVRADVTEPGPLAKDTRALELRKELECVPRGVLEKRERARGVVRR